MRQDSFPQQINEKAGISAPIVLVAVLAVIGLSLAMGCRSTPPAPEDVEVETPTADFDDVDEPADPDDEDRDDDAREEGEEDRDDEKEGEQVASHVDARIDSALSDAEAGDLEGAMDALRRLVDEPEGGFLAAYNLGVLHEAVGEADRAIEYYVQALRRQPDFTPALTNLLRIYIRAGELGEADTLGREFVELRPDNLDHRAAHLEVVLADGRYQDVVQGARFILRRDVDHVDAMIQFATAKYRLGQFEFSEAIIGTALGISPERAEGYYLLAKIAWAQEDFGRATRLFRMAVDYEPRFLEARNNYAVLLHRVGDYKSAVEQLEKAIEMAPNFAPAYINLGNAHKELCAQIMTEPEPEEPCAYEKSAEAYRQAVEIDPENPDAWLNLGLLYLEAPVGELEETERMERAIEAFQEFRNQAGPQRAEEANVGEFMSRAHEILGEIEEEIEEERRQQAEEEEEPLEPEEPVEDEEEFDEVDDSQDDDGLGEEDEDDASEELDEE